MRKTINSFVTIMCILSLQVSIALAGGSSSTGDGSENPEGDIPPITSQQRSEKNWFNEILKMYAASKTSFTSTLNIEKLKTGYNFYKTSSSIFIYNSDGKKVGNSHEIFNYYLVDKGMEGYTQKLNLINFISVNDDTIDVTSTKHEDIAKLTDGRLVKLKSAKHNNELYIIGIITTDDEGKCFEKYIRSKNNFDLIEPKNGVCTVFYLKR